MIMMLQGRCIPSLYWYDLTHVGVWEPYKPHDLGRASWVGSVLFPNPSRQITTAGWGLDDLYVDRSDRS